jgi:proline dehydrogenase
MIDAEHTYYQEGISAITNDLAREFNTDYPVVFSTYQLYLKDGLANLKTDLERANTGNYKFAAKLVRGAYMVLERKRAEDMGYEDPILPTIEDTHASYNAGVEETLRRIAQGLYVS